MRSLLIGAVLRCQRFLQPAQFRGIGVWFMNIQGSPATHLVPFLPSLSFVCLNPPLPICFIPAGHWLYQSCTPESTRKTMKTPSTCHLPPCLSCRLALPYQSQRPNCLWRRLRVHGEKTCSRGCFDSVSASCYAHLPGISLLTNSFPRLLSGPDS